MAKVFELDLNPNEKTLRQFGYIALFGFGLLAVCAFFESWMFAFGLGAARLPVASVLGALALYAVLCSLIYPKANRLLFVGFSVLMYPIGFLMSYVILGVLFFGVFAPIGALLRLFGEDPLRRAYEKSQTSYWSETRLNRPKESYFRQF